MGNGMYVKSNGIWRPATAMYCTDGAFRAAKPWIREGGIWRPCYAQGGVISALKPGSIVYLPENGVQTAFLVLKHDYEGSGRTLVIRNRSVAYLMWDAIGYTAYAEGSLDTWLNETYLARLGEVVRGMIEAVSIPYTVGNGDTTVARMERKVFLLSGTEVGAPQDELMGREGAHIPYFDSDAKRVFRNITANTGAIWWLRSPVNDPDYPIYAYTVTATGGIGMEFTMESSNVVPAFTLPAGAPVAANGDGSYTLA